jgi:hypothetical protein
VHRLDNLSIAFNFMEQKGILLTNVRAAGECILFGWCALATCRCVAGCWLLAACIATVYEAVC